MPRSLAFAGTQFACHMKNMDDHLSQKRERFQSAYLVHGLFLFIVLAGIAFRVINHYLC
jgi:hypothetical protein